MRLETERLILRDYNLNDFRTCHAYARDPAVCEYCSWGPNTVEVTQNFIEMQVREAAEEPRLNFGLAIVEKSTGLHFGGVGLRRSSLQDQEADLGYVLAKSFWGQGFATEACQKILEFAFLEKGFRKITALVLPDNLASINVIEKMGMRKVTGESKKLQVKGLLRECFQFEVLSSIVSK